MHEEQQNGTRNSLRPAHFQIKQGVVYKERRRKTSTITELTCFERQIMQIQRFINSCKKKKLQCILLILHYFPYIHLFIYVGNKSLKLQREITCALRCFVHYLQSFRVLSLLFRLFLIVIFALFNCQIFAIKDEDYY